MEKLVINVLIFFHLTVSKKDLNKQMSLLLQTRYYVRPLFEKTGLYFVDLSESKQISVLLCTLCMCLQSVVCMSTFWVHVGSH